MFITLELAKFKKNLNDIHSNLDKLIYTMKNLHKAKTPKQYPQFWNEEWLDVAIKELDTKKLTPEQRFAYEMTISKNAVILRNEEKKIKAAVDKAEEKARESTYLAIKTESVKKAIQRAKLTIQEIAEDNDVSVDFVLDIQNQLSESASN